MANNRLTDTYFIYQKKYERIYGEKTIILMEVGSFFELYGIDNENEKQGNIKPVCNLLNIILSRKNKTILENSRSNPLMAGFPNHSLKRFLEILIKHNYTVILIEQTNPPLNTKREVTQIISKSTYIDNVNQIQNNYAVSIYLIENKCFKTGLPLIEYGCSAIDIGTGDVIFYENHIVNKNILLIFEDIYRFIETCNAVEIIVHNECKSIDNRTIINHLDTTRKILFNLFPIQECKNINYQNNFIKKIYKNIGLLTPIEYIQCEMKPNLVLSFIFCCKFIYEHSQDILHKIKFPKFWNKNNHLVLTNNTLYQLDIISNTVQDYNGHKIKSLFDVINKTKTPMGFRILKYRLLNPIVDINILNQRYNLISEFIKLDKKQDTNFIGNIVSKLTGINDIEKLIRKCILKKIIPSEFYQIYSSFKIIKYIFEYISQFDIKIQDDNLNELISQLNLFIENIETSINLENCLKYDFKHIADNLFLESINSNLDELVKKINEIKLFFEKEIIFLKSFLPIKDKNNDTIKLCKTEKGGYYLSCSKTRTNIILKGIKSNSKEYDIKYTSSVAKFTSEKINKKSDELLDLYENLRIETIKFWNSFLYDLMIKYENIIIKSIENISEIDFIQSLSKIAIENKYCCPIIEEKEESFIEIEELRHPIIEKLDNDTLYIPNDIEFNNDKYGTLLFSINGAGKSSLMKATGLNLILAQIGSFVACSKFKFYPFNKIFTRIQGNDNLFRGHSSFEIEMLELKSIIQDSDCNSLVLGDEICKGTEDISGLSIVASALHFFEQRKVKYIFATHLHKLTELDIVKKLEHCSIKHLEVEINNDKLIYKRKLNDGSGKSIYGLEVAKYILNDNEFMKISNKVRDKILNKSEEILSNKKSSYNSKIILDKCEICNKTEHELGKGNLDVHHITFQKDFLKNNEHIKFNKNDKGNLVVLCEEHHTKVHNGEILIKGFIKTENGSILNYENQQIKKVKSKKKYTEEEKEFLDKYRDSNLSINYILNLMKSNGFKIGRERIKTYLQN